MKKDPVISPRSQSEEVAGGGSQILGFLLKSLFFQPHQESGHAASSINSSVPKIGRAIEVYLVLYYVPVSLSSFSPGVGTITLPCASLRESLKLSDL